ncbi:hypothetical protein JTB14_012717 [Gonioctena quinquepunctata]|nr:hypothetical protein JTB14_012717 [Gonioctena quinquepunctata]
MWVIANFALENAVEVVSQKWISGNQCYWSTYRGPELKSAIADRYNVWDDWDIHPIRILNKNKTYDDVVTARYACDRAQFTLDCSENEAKRIIKKVLSSNMIQKMNSRRGFGQPLPSLTPEGFSENYMKKSKMKCQVEKKNNLSGSFHGKNHIITF